MDIQKPSEFEGALTPSRYERVGYNYRRNNFGFLSELYVYEFVSDIKF